MIEYKSNYSLRYLDGNPGKSPLAPIEIMANVLFAPMIEYKSNYSLRYLDGNPGKSPLAPIEILAKVPFAPLIEIWDTGAAF